MTEKRFKLVDPFGIDDVTNDYRVMDCASSLDADVLCDLLNELNDENEQLKSRIQLLSTLLDNADAIIDLSDDDTSKRFWNKINEDAEQKWEEILKG